MTASMRGKVGNELLALGHVAPAGAVPAGRELQPAGFDLLYGQRCNCEDRDH